MADELPISIDPDAINKYVADRIIESALGERLQETVSKAIDAFGSYGNDPLKSAVTAEINNQIMVLIKTEFAPQIQAAVREKMTDDYINKLVDEFMYSISAKLGRGY